MFRYLVPWPALAALCAAGGAQAHGFAGQRFFPATIATDDPFVSDELSLPTMTFAPVDTGDGSARATVAALDYSKRITPRLGLGVGQDYTWLHPVGGDHASGGGAGNLELNAKYLLDENDEHEWLLAVGLAAELGGTAARRNGADDFTTWTPAAFFGRGLGDVGATWLRPLAVTGEIGVALPDRARTVSDEGEERNPHVLQLGVALEYSLLYLQSAVKDIGMPAPLDRMIAVIELATATPLDRGQDGQLSGTVNPGALWAGRNLQLGFEVNIPMNRRTGDHVGVTAQLHWFIDDLLPHSLGQPVLP
jgi:hypothetical protein